MQANGGNFAEALRMGAAISRQIQKKDFFIDCRVYLNLRSHFKLIEDNNTVY